MFQAFGNMFFAPHKLQRLVRTITRDTYNRPSSETETWIDVCKCRCDDNSSQELISDNGKVYKSNYHVVADPCDVQNGEDLRVMNGLSVRGAGKARNVKHLNVLQYTDIWL